MNVTREVSIGTKNVQVRDAELYAFGPFTYATNEFLASDGVSWKVHGIGLALGFIALQFSIYKKL